MSIIECIAFSLQAYKAERHISVSVLAEHLGIAESSLQCYLKGAANPRANTIELLASKMDISVAELVSGPVPQRERAEAAIRAVREFSCLTAVQQKKALQLFLELTNPPSQDF